MTYLTETQFRALPIGTRILFPEGAEAFPCFNFREALSGTLIETDDIMALVRLDEHKPDLDEWENVIQVHFEDAEINEGALSHRMVLQPLDANDGSLDKFVQVYCEHNGIEIDGDVFGLVFSEADRQWTPFEAMQIIEDAARIYGLRS